MIEYENQHVRLAIDDAGRCHSLVDLRSGLNLAVGAPCAWIEQCGTRHPVSAATRDSERVHLAFGTTGVEATLAVVPRPGYMVLEVLGVDGPAVSELGFLDVPLHEAGEADPSFAACALALDLQTRVPDLPGLSRHLRASCFARFGLRGARAALIACPRAHLRPMLQEVVANELRLPYSPIGGPWAMDQPRNAGSYLFDFAGVTVAEVDEWIRLLRRLGFDQLDFHGGRSFRFGDCRPDPERYPGGFADLRAVVERLHAAGMQAGLHTYAFFIDKSCPWVTPVPDPRLAKDATLTLAAPLSAGGTDVLVRESTAGMSAVTGFFVRNSATLQIEDELITYAAVRQAPPYGFTGCQRGACGTRAAAHAPGAAVHHLKECFGLFVPDPHTTLLAEVAAHTAAAFNECGFDMMYLDALDGEDVLGGAEDGWHYGSQFVFELWRRLQRPALMEMSTFHHHLWYVRSRMGAWDHPRRSHKRFIDLHCAANESCRRMFLPANLGWWAVKTWDGANGEPTFADDIEYLCAKALGTGSGLSLMGIEPGNVERIPALPRLAAILREWETLRRAGTVPEALRARLAQPGAEFTLVHAADGTPMFRPVQYARHRVECLESWSNEWTVNHPWPAQAAALRIEALLGAGPYGAVDNPVLADFAAPEDFTRRAAAGEVSVELARVGESWTNGNPAVAGAACGRLEAHSGRPSRTGAWAQIGKALDPPLDLRSHAGLGVWIRGDGNGEVLNFQLRSPEHLSPAIGDHYVVIDFEGWRYFELIEPEGERYADYEWPYGSPYSIYRENVDMGSVGSLDLWLNALPPAAAVTCCLGPIQALPVRELALRDPAVRIGERQVTFPVELRTGCYLEFEPPSAFRVYGPHGELLEEGTAAGEVPMLAPGANPVHFGCTVAPGVRPRARVTVIGRGEPLCG